MNEPKYDPDRMRFEDLDLSDLGAMKEYLDHPNTKAAYEDLARAIPHMAVEDRRKLYERELASAEDNYRRASEALKTERNDEARTLLEEIRYQASASIKALLERLRELPTGEAG